MEKCHKCESDREPYFSRTEPMGYFCPECGSEDKPGTKYQVTKGGKMLPDDPDYATKYKKGEIWVVHQSSIGLQLLKNNRIGILNAPRLIRYGIETGKLKEMEIPSTSNAQSDRIPGQKGSDE